MNVYEILKEDHRNAAKLLEKLSKKVNGEKKEELFLELKKELELHMWVEENFVYPALREAAETTDLALEAIEEHRVVKTLLEELDDTGIEKDEWDAKFKVLKENIEHHVEEEEGEMFPRAHKVFSADEAEKLGAKIATEKATEKAVR